MKKIGPNDPCPCGSGKKYKKCCLNKINDSTIRLIQDTVEKMKARNKQLIEQQGLGKKIISCLHNGVRFVAVGNKVFYSNKWKTFHDFLFSYIVRVIGKDWVEEEHKKPQEERHPIIEWIDCSIEDRKKGAVNATDREIFTYKCSCETVTLIRAAYGLYLLAHNVKLQDFLIKRLKQKEKFYASFQELVVASSFILAGFVLELENEEDSTDSHCEFNGIFKETEDKFSVEVKSRKIGKFNIGTSLHKALKKKAKYTRIICLGITVDDFQNARAKIIEEVKDKEEKMTIDGEPAPPAYIVGFNDFYLSDSNGISGFIEGFKIPDIKDKSSFKDFIEMFKSLQKHKPIWELFNGMKKFSNIPSTFDGGIPEFEFNTDAAEKRLIVGNRYSLDDGTFGILEQGIVLEAKKSAFCVFNVEGKRMIYSVPLSDMEMSAYSQHPETFFGTIGNVTKHLRDPLDFFEFLYNSYKNASKEKLLEFLKGHPRIKDFEAMSREDVLLNFCNAATISECVKNKGKGGIWDC